MQVLMFLLLIVGNMRNMQYNMQQYAKYSNTISVCRICTPHFADGEEWRGPIRDGMGGRRRLQQAEPGRAGIKIWRYGKVPLLRSRPMTRWDLTPFDVCPL